jgi:Uma2 family endonuclease
MPTATATTAAPPGLMTAEEFHDWANQPKQVGTSYELEDGKVVEVSRPGDNHGLICSWLTYLLWQYCLLHGCGRVLSHDTGLLVKQNPDTLRGPDHMLFLESKPLHETSMKYVTDIPSLIVEVRSPDDRAGKIKKRVTEYLGRGAGIVWVVDPKIRVVTVYRRHKPAKVHGEKDVLDGNGVLPGFTLAVSQIFTLPGTANGGAA